MEKHRLGNFISLLRKEKGLTQRELAEALCITDKAISRWETGKSYPDVEMLQKIAAYFEVSVNELLQGERVPEKDIVTISDSNLTNSFKKLNVIKKRYRTTIFVCIILIIGTCSLLHQFIKTNTDLIMWNYDVVSESFVKASERIAEGEENDRGVLEELAKTSFRPVWQTKSLTKPLLINKKWYSSNLDGYLFNCIDPDLLTDVEVKALTDKIDDIALEINKIDWATIRDNGKKRLVITNKDIFDVISNVDEIAGEWDES